MCDFLNEINRIGSRAVVAVAASFCELFRVEDDRVHLAVAVHYAQEGSGFPDDNQWQSRDRRFSDGGSGCCLEGDYGHSFCRVIRVGASEQALLSLIKSHHTKGIQPDRNWVCATVRSGLVCLSQ
jgi:hypothetical protein